MLLKKKRHLWCFISACFSMQRIADWLQSSNPTIAYRIGCKAAILQEDTGLAASLFPRTRGRSHPWRGSYKPNQAIALRSVFFVSFLLTRASSVRKPETKKPDLRRA